MISYCVYIHIQYITCVCVCVYIQCILHLLELNKCSELGVVFQFNLPKLSAQGKPMCVCNIKKEKTPEFLVHLEAQSVQCVQTQ